jgi:hypothetical protein
MAFDISTRENIITKIIASAADIFVHNENRILSSKYYTTKLFLFLMYNVS